MDYGQRHRCELAAAARVATALGARQVTVRLDLRAIGGSALTDVMDVPKDGPTPGVIPVTYVPARNLIFLSIASAMAERINARDLFIGVTAVDSSGYPDCRRAFIDAFTHAANLGTKAGATSSGPHFAVHTPLINLTKAAIITLGSRLGVDFTLTSSCYDPDAEGRACRTCDSCRIRARGFAEAGLPDPTRYSPHKA